MADSGLQIQAATITVPVKPDVTEFDRAMKSIEERIDAIPARFEAAFSKVRTDIEGLSDVVGSVPEKFGAAIERVGSDIAAKIEEWKREIQNIGDSASRVRDDARAASGSGADRAAGAVNDGETHRSEVERRLEEIVRGMDEIKAALEGLIVGGT